MPAPPARAERLAPGPVLAPAFGDADPPDWTGREPDSYPVHGIDVSRWNLDVNWHAARGGRELRLRHGERGRPPGRSAVLHPHRAGQGCRRHRGPVTASSGAPMPQPGARGAIAHVPRRSGGLPTALGLDSRPCARAAAGPALGVPAVFPHRPRARDRWRREPERLRGRASGLGRLACAPRPAPPPGPRAPGRGGAAPPARSALPPGIFEDRKWGLTEASLNHRRAGGHSAGHAGCPRSPRHPRAGAAS